MARWLCCVPPRASARTLRSAIAFRNLSDVVASAERAGGGSSWRWSWWWWWDLLWKHQLAVGCSQALVKIGNICLSMLSRVAACGKTPGKVMNSLQDSPLNFEVGNVPCFEIRKGSKSTPNSTSPVRHVMCASGPHFSACGFIYFRFWRLARFVQLICPPDDYKKTQ